MDRVDKSQNYKDLYGILLSLQGSHLNSFLRKTFKLGWVAFHSLTFQMKCLDFQCNQYKKTRPSPLTFLQLAMARRRSETSLDAFKAKDTRFVADWLKSKGLHKLCSVLEGIQEPFILSLARTSVTHQTMFTYAA